MTLSHNNKRTKRVKAWAIIRPSDAKLVEYSSAPEMRLAEPPLCIYEDQKLAKAGRKASKQHAGTNYQVVPCVISFALPTPHKRGV